MLFGKTFRLVKIFGIEINFDASWLIIFFLITWMFSSQYFPLTLSQASTAKSISLGIVASVLFFSSVIAHELAHSIVARRNGLQVNTITMFIFGGASNLETEPQNPWTEFKMAFVGPLSSIVIGMIFGLFSWVSQTTGADEGFVAIFGVLSFINIFLGIFNMLPGFPLDGGRVFRSIIWHFNNDYLKSTKLATLGGKTIAYLLFFIGGINILNNLFVQGLWLIMMGFFLNALAELSLRQVVIKEELVKIDVSSIAKEGYPLVSPKTKMADVLPEFFSFKTDTLLTGRRNKIMGFIRLKEAEHLDEQEVGKESAELTHSFGKEDILSPKDDAFKAMKIMQKNDISCLPVDGEDGHKKIVFKQDIMGILKEKARGI